MTSVNNALTKEIDDLRSALSSEDTTVNDALSYVNYGYDTPHYQPEKPSGSWSTKTGIKRDGPVIVLNKSTNINYDIRLKFSGDIGIAYSNATVEEWTNGISLKAGHEYDCKAELISGASTNDGEIMLPIITCYRTGEHNTVGSSTRDDTETHRFFTAESGVQYNLCFFISKNQYVFTNAKFLVTLEDLTESKITHISMIADKYDSAKTYAVGDYCIYSGNLHRCTTAIATAEAWTAAHWTQVQVDGELGNLKSDLSTTDMLVNDNGAYVNYNYDTPYSQAEASSGSWNQKIGITRLKYRVTLNKHTDLGYSDSVLRIKVSGEIGLGMSNEAVDAWTTGITLKAGHKYAVIVKKLGGTSTYQPSGEEAVDQPPYAVAFVAGEHADISGSPERSENTATRYFVAESNKQYNIALYINTTNYMFTDADFFVLLEDCTESEMYSVKQNVVESQEEISYINAMTEKLAQKIGLDADIGEQFIFTDFGRINYVTGAVQTGSSQLTSYSNAVKIAAYDKLTVTMPQYTASGSGTASGLAFYDMNGDYISGIQNDHDDELETSIPHLREIAVPENAETVRLTWFLSTSAYYSEFSCVGTISGEVVDENVLPDYYFEDGYIDGLVKTINDNNKVMGMRNYTFFFFSDPHFYHMSSGTLFNGMNGVALMKYIGDRTNIRKIICGGDLTSGGEITNDVMVSYLGKVLCYLSPVWDKTYMVYGNHEWNNTGNTSEWADAERMTVTQIYNMLVKDKEREFGALQIGNGVGVGYGSYWIDDPVQKMRVFYIPCNTGNIIREQPLLWLAEQLGEIPAGYAVAVVSHVGIAYEKVDEVYTGQIIYSGRFDYIAEMLDALKTQSTYTYVRPTDPDWTRTFDYSGTDVTVVGAFTGHTHIDMSKITTEGIPVIGITCDRGPTGKTSSAFNAARKIGTIREQAIDCVQIDLNNRKIYTTRIGGSWAYDLDTGTSGPMENPNREFSF